MSVSREADVMFVAVAVIVLAVPRLSTPSGTLKPTVPAPGIVTDVEPTKTFADLLVDGTRPLTEIVNQIREALDGRVAGVGTGSTLESREARRHGAKLNVASRFNVAQAGEE